MAKKVLSIRKRLGFSLVALFTISFGVLLIATDQIIKRDRLQRHERLVMATAMSIENEIEQVIDKEGAKRQILDEKSYRKILNEFSATRVLLWLSRPEKKPIFPDVASIDQFLADSELLKIAGLNASGMQKPRIFNFKGQTYITCSLPLPANQGVLRFLEDVGVSPAGRKENLLALFFIWIASVAFSTVLIRKIMKKSLNPLEKLELIMDEISLRSSGLVLDKQISSSSQPAELQGIVTSYNRLAARLQASWTQQLLFMSSIRHELSTPLTLIDISASRLDRRVQGLKIEDRELLLSIKYQARNADNLVRDIVDLARGDSDNYQLKLSSLAAVEIIEDLSDQLKPLSWGERVLTPSPDDLRDLEAIEIKVNLERLRQSIINVLENASKYSPAEKPIELSMSLVNQLICFDIRDYGSGIPKEKFQIIFQPFRRCGSESSGISGSGVGLAFVHELVKLMNGRIYVLSSSNEGTIIRFEFPIVVNDDVDRLS